ncbi:unnamed protein product [Rotaria sordida]|uniref:CCHC-type domain-containing protein n=1 Tax=Rotaria sordida TaxID=392033 RepID=A0A814ARY6_9BILA|nr:unnamed protein product [Rotaria sordida]CAF4049092.1 unnamed protein product [Rotaria sordida]CAF4095878.1 unnamed protein product [Rotaria sordida]
MSEQKQERIPQTTILNRNNIMANSFNTNSPPQSTIKNDSASSIQTDITETKIAASQQVNDQSQSQSPSHPTNINEDRELARIPYYNGKTNIYSWLIAIKSVFIDLEYDETTWANKAKYYLSDDAAQFVYLNDNEMTNWNTFQKLMIDQYSSKPTTFDSTYPLVNTPVDPHMMLQQHTTYSLDVLAQKAHHALVLEDLKTLPKFSGETSQSISTWLEEIEVIYNKAFITDIDKCHRTLKLLLNVDENWLEFIRRQKLEWNELKQKLISRFEGKKDSSRIQREDDIRNRRYHGNESMHHYYSDIMRKCDLLEEEYPVSDRHRIDYIIRGLPNSIQDQLLIREFATPKELLEVLQKIEEGRKRVHFEEHVISIDENAPSSTIKPNTSITQQPVQYNNNMFQNNQPQNYHPPSHYYKANNFMPPHSVPNYYQQHPQQHRSIQCYTCGKFGHKATNCFKSKQRLN